MSLVHLSSLLLHFIIDIAVRVNDVFDDLFTSGQPLLFVRRLRSGLSETSLLNDSLLSHAQLGIASGVLESCLGRGVVHAEVVISRA